MRVAIQILLTALSFIFYLSCSSKVAPDIAVTDVWAKNPVTPSRLLILIADQFQDEYIDKYDLKNFQAFRNRTLRFPNAFVGHLPSSNIISHAVLTTGLLPKNLPFQDQVFHDIKGELGAKGQYYSLDKLNKKQFDRLLKNTAETNLHTRLKYGHRGDTFTISNAKNIAYALGSPYSDLLITLGEPNKSNPLKGWCVPTGNDVPDYFLYPFQGRFFLDCSQPYGTEKTFFPLNGNQFVAGTDPAHLGGDTWVTDAVLEVMKQEADWRAIFANFASLDQALSLYAEYDGTSPFPDAESSPIAFKKTLRTLDEQFGKIIRYLEEKKLLKETMIVVTSTHGGQRAVQFYGMGNPTETQRDRISGVLKNLNHPTAPTALQGVLKSNLIKAISYDTSLKFFLSTEDTVQVSKLASQISELPGVAEVYTRQNLQYVRNFRHKDVVGPWLDWAKEKHQDLVNTMTNRGAPDIIAILSIGTNYGTYGDSGCPHKNTCQRIPVMIWSPNLVAQENNHPIRLVDLNPVISRVLKLNSQPLTLDGSKAAVDSLILEP